MNYFRLLELAVCGVLFLAASSNAQIDCSGLPDGVYGYGCRSYTNCTGGRGYIVDCAPGNVFDVQVGYCRPIADVPPPCGSQEDCTTLQDGRYPVMPDCRYFFTCQEGRFLGTNPCNDPPEIGDLVFDLEMQLCNWKWDVQEPCGIYVPPTVPPEVETTVERK